MVSSFSLDEVVNLCPSVLTGEFKVLQDLWKPYKPPWKQSKRSTARSWTCYCRRLVILTYESLPKPEKKIIRRTTVSILATLKRTCNFW